jgi:2-polyprenyl-3-methyl-5-hydroxy-6-metoxy-1,4-benzoquinol methylase
MKAVDRWLQSLRIRKAAHHIPANGRVLDIGCADGALFRQLDGRIAGGVGVDPELERSIDMGSFKLVRGWFPRDLQDSGPFDAITMLATLEHVPIDAQAEIAKSCVELLGPNGRLIVTVPSERVDSILGLLRRLRLIDGMSLEQHYGFDPRLTRSIFSREGMSLVTAETFELGLNHLFVFEKSTKSGRG